VANLGQKPKMRILITGATGLVGQELTRQLHGAGHEVYYLTTSPNKIETKSNYKGFLWNTAKGEIDTACLDGVSTIVHLAGASIAERWTEAYKKTILESRTETANLLLRALKETDHEVEQFVSASAIGAYPSSKTQLYTESFEKYNPGFLGTVVEAWEKAADQFETLGLEVAKVRVGVVLAKNGGALEKLIQPIKYYVGSPLGDGQQWQSWIHLEDLAGIFKEVILNKNNGVYNAVAPAPVTNETLTKEVALILNKPLIFPKVPAFMLKLILGEMAAVVLESQKVSSQKIEHQSYSFKYTQLNQALRDLLA